MTAENCISQAKIYAKQNLMCHMKTLQDSFKDQQLIPLIIKVKKASDFKSCQVSDIQIGCEDQPCVKYSIVTLLFMDSLTK